MRGKNEHVLYLDFDGVLHHSEVWYHPRIGPYLPAKVPERYKLFAHLRLLEELLQPYRHVSIVLSTSWSQRYGPHRAGKNLGHTLGPRVIGATFHSRMTRDEFEDKGRGMQVWEDVQRRKPAEWLALDDNDEGWPDEALPRFIRTHITEGIGAPVVQAEIKEKFAEHFGVARNA
jgi:hypothetical protein